MNPAFNKMDQATQPGDQIVPSVSVNTDYDKRWYIYCTYFFCSFGDRTWEFASVVFMMELYPDTLLYAAMFGLCEAVTGIITGPSIGKYIDTHDRLITIRTALIGQDISIATASLIFYVGLSLHVQYQIRSLIYCVLVLCAAVARISSSISKVSLNKDWIVAMTQGNPQQLTPLNASVRRIDLTCSIGAPLLVGVLSAITTSTTAIAAIGIWNICSLPIEYMLAKWVYDNVTQLQNKIPNVSNHSIELISIDSNRTYINTASTLQLLTVQHDEISFHDNPSLHIDKHVLNVLPIFRGVMSSVHLWYHTSKYSWIAYREHPSFIASVAYCFTYLSVINFGSLMTAYLKTIQFSDVALAGSRAAGAIVAVMSTIVVPHMVKRIGVASSAGICIWIQVLFLTCVLASFWLPQTQNSIFILVFGIACSRFGLWGFDLAVTQIMQETVDPTKTGAINATQESLLNVMYLASFLLNVIFSEPKEFLWPVTISYIAVLTAAVLYRSWANDNAHQYHLLVQQQNTT